MSKEIYVVNCYTCQHNGQETCKGCNTLLNGDVEPYENWELREDLSQKDQRIAELEQELAELKEKDNYHLRYELAGADETITNLKQQLEEKDKEIEDWKQKTQTFLNRVSEQNYEIANNDPTQLAIQELEKVKNFVDGRTYCANYIKKRIKELEGE